MPPETQSRDTRPAGAPAYYLGRPVRWRITATRVWRGPVPGSPEPGKPAPSDGDLFPLLWKEA